MTNALAWDGDERSEPRDEVHHRARAIDAAGAVHAMLIVNLSPRGMRARIDGAFAPGDRLQVALPVIGPLVAEVRWALGGRVGCRFVAPVPAADYRRLLAAVKR